MPYSNPVYQDLTFITDEAVLTQTPSSDLSNEISLDALTSGILFQKSNAWIDLAGTTTINTSNTLTGVGTSFLGKVKIGDRIVLSSAPSSSVRVSAVVSNTELTLDRAVGNGTSQTMRLYHYVVRFADQTGDNNFLITSEGNLFLGKFFCCIFFVQFVCSVNDETFAHVMNCAFTVVVGVNAIK
jgi:hypothetical protein